VSAQTLDGVVVVPQSAVVEEQGDRSVFIAKNGRADKRSVQLGATDGENVVILTGVSEGESLIVMGQRDLVDGQLIHVVE
jgi:membrane fusion protein (multidrug efflux system)